MSPPPIKGNLPLGGVYDPLPRGSLDLCGPRELLVGRSMAGAYEPDGTIATDTLRAMLESAFVGAVKGRIAVEDVVDLHEGEVVWGGTVMGHYGHFLTESVGRLWPVCPGAELEGLPVVLTTPQDSPFVLDWLRAFGVEAIELPEKGTVRFSRMFVPKSALRHGAWIAPEIRDIHLCARRGLDVSPSPRHDVLWLSRSKLARDHVAYDECLLEWLLGEYVTIVRPETMTLTEQVAVLEGCRAVAGVAGSAFHTLLMVEQPPDCLYLCPSWDKGVYPAQHRYLDGDATFVQALAVTARKRRARKGVAFPGAYRLLIPETLRALGETLLPTLLDDPRLAAFADPGGGQPAGGTELDAAAMRVLLDPLATELRLELSALFEAAGLSDCALEQRMAVEDLNDE
jgi:hypothetical protein